MERELLLHVLGDPGAVSHGLRVLANARAALGASPRLVLVVQGAAVSDLTTATTALTEATSAENTAVVACANSLASLELHAEALASGVGVVPAAVAFLAERQWSGAAYLRL